MPRLPDQELPLSIRYWEGAVSVTGTVSGEPAAGLGYVELTGYAEGARAAASEGIAPRETGGWTGGVGLAALARGIRIHA